MENVPCSGIVRLNSVKMLILPKLIYRLKAIPIKILTGYFVEINKHDFKIYMERQRTRIGETVMKKNTVGGHIRPGFQTSNTATVISTVTVKY